MSKIADIQRILEVDPDGVWGPQSKLALERLVNPAARPKSAGTADATTSSPLDPHRALQWPLEREASLFYGQSDGSARWEEVHLVTITPPYPMHMDSAPILRIRCHKLVADSLLRCLQDIAKIYPTAGERRAAGVDSY